MFYGASVLASHQLLHPSHSGFLVPLKQGQAFPSPPTNGGKSISQHCKTRHYKMGAFLLTEFLYISLRCLEMGRELPFPDTLSDDVTTWTIITGQMFSAAAGEK